MPKTKKAPLSRDDVGALFEEHGGKAKRMALAVTGSRDDADDVTQEAFLRALRSEGVLSTPGGFERWLVKTAGNMAFSKARDNRVRRLRETPLDADYADTAPTPAQSFEESQDRRVMMEAVRQEMAHVNAGDRRLILLELEGMSVKEMAEVVETSESSVRQKLRRGKNKLRERLHDRFAQD